MSEKRNKKVDTEIIMSFDDLPSGYELLNEKLTGIELSEGEQRNFAILLLSGDSTMCYFLYIKEHLQSNDYYNLLKKLKDAKIHIIKECETDTITLSKIYEENKQDSSQKATKEDSNAIAFFELMLGDAMSMSVSDIHIYSRPSNSIIKMRKHGELMQWRRGGIKQSDIDALCSAVYNVLAENKQVSFDSKTYQAAAIPYKIGSETVKLRYQSLPVYPDGYDVVLRVLPIGRDELFTPLHVLGYTEQQVRDLLEAAAKPLGAMIIAGVTGSGKSTTLKNLLMFINESTEYKLKIYTIEDPPEYKIAHVSQIPVVRQKGASEDDNKSAFDEPIKACMRADPDIIMVGEVRDATTGILTQRAVQSGHQVLTTVHAPSGTGIIDRFVDFQVGRAVLGSADFLSALIYQKLLPTLCPHCKISFTSLLKVDEPELKNIEMAQRLAKVKIDTDKYDLFVRNPSGCDKCDNMGINGRQVCAEIIKIDIALREKILRGDGIGLIKQWRSKSDGRLESTNMEGKTCMEHAVQKMLTGIISPFDVESNFESLNNLYLDNQVFENKKENTNSQIQVKNTDSNENDDFWSSVDK